jgi:FK506-binding protein 4/5
VQEKKSWDLNEEDKVAEAAAAKERGNAKFKAGLWQAAVKRYNRATQMIDYDKNFKEENLAQSSSIKRNCYLNLAAAQLKLGKLNKAIEACNKVKSWFSSGNCIICEVLGFEDKMA